MKHSPPRIDHFGYNKIMNIKPGSEAVNILKEKEKIRMPPGWGQLNETETKTRSKLLEDRHNAKKFDLSYDLDGDGYVGGRDLVIAKQFDKGDKGKLT